MSFFELLISLLSLTILEIVLGIDNLIILAIISQRLPKKQQAKARHIGLTLAWISRLFLLAFAVWLTQLTKPLFSFFDHGFSGRDLFLISGGLFLLTKSTQEIHSEIEEDNENSEKTKKKGSLFFIVVGQIVLLDVVFSLDSVLTAIGLTQNFYLMATAITFAIILMVWSSEPLSQFIYRHPTIKMLALSFLLLVGTFLVADGLGYHIPRGYLYFAMIFSLLVEALNVLRGKRASRLKS